MSDASASQATSGRETEKSFTIPTARGDEIDSSRLGFTLSAELIIQESPEISLNWPDQSFAAVPEEERIADVAAKLETAADHGIDSMIDRAIPGIGRDIPRMKKIAERTRLNILVLTGWYTLRDLEYFFQLPEEFPEVFAGRPTFADLMVRDIEEGVAGTGVRCAGIKVVSDRYGIRGKEAGDVRIVFRHAAEAHRRTGAPLMTHSVGIESGLEQQDVFEEDGVDLTRTLLCHMERSPGRAELADFERALDRGSFLSFEWGTVEDKEPTVGGIEPATVEENVNRVVSLLEGGYEDQLLMSSCECAFVDCVLGMPDTYPKFTSVVLDIIPRLKERGVSEAMIDKMMIENPRKVLSSLARGAY